MGLNPDPGRCDCFSSAGSSKIKIRTPSWHRSKAQLALCHSRSTSTTCMYAKTVKLNRVKPTQERSVEKPRAPARRDKSSGCCANTMMLLLRSRACALHGIPVAAAAAAAAALAPTRCRPLSSSAGGSLLLPANRAANSIGPCRGPPGPVALAIPTHFRLALRDI